MIDAISRSIDVPSTDPDDRRRARLLNIFLLGLSTLDVVAILLVSVLILLDNSLIGNMISTLWSALAFLAFAGIVYSINRKGLFTLASSLFLIVLTLAITGADVEAIGRGDTLFYFVIPVLAASALIRPYAGFFMAGFNSLIFVGVAQVLQLEPDFYIGVVGMFAIALFSWIAAMNLQNALRDLRVINAELDERVAQRTQELETANVKLEQQTLELAEANEQLKVLDQMKSKFVSDVSHELRTPINNISIYLEMLESGNPDKSERYLAVLGQETNRLEKLVADVLDLSRFEAAQQGAEYLQVDLNAIVGQVVDANQLRADAKSLEMTFDRAEDLPFVLADTNQLTLAINNLIGNAINYTLEGRVHISTQSVSKGDQILLTVSDTGFGIPAEDIPHLFERFYRGQRAGKSSIPGTGLGLAIAKEIIEEHGGYVEVESQENQGSTFRVYLPTVVLE